MKPRYGACAVVLVVTLAIRAAYAAPDVVTAQIKASHCCATRCGHPVSRPAADQCCHVATHATDAAILATSVDLAAPVAVGPYTEYAATCTRRTGRRVASTLFVGGGTGPPLFLAIRTLRL